MAYGHDVVLQHISSGLEATSLPAAVLKMRSNGSAHLSSKIELTRIVSSPA